jgi:hypothetical protein
MLAQTQTSGQVDPKHNNTTQKRGNVLSFVINGCTVSVSSSNKTDEPIKAVKEILLSSYRSRIARC